jgi:hypothetical protein
MPQRIKVAIVLLGLTALTFIWIFTSGNLSMSDPNNHSDSFDSPIDVTLDFYGEWLTVRQSATSTSLVRLPGMDVLTDGLRARLAESVAAVPEVDPLLCTVAVPENILGRVVYETDTAAEVMVYGKDQATPERSLATLDLTDNGWIITGISCSRGEVAPEVEFTFEQTGNLLKASLVTPLDSNKWHLVYTRDGQPGYAAPLYFDAASTCVSSDGTQTVCIPDTLIEPQSATVKGDMTEAGIKVTLLELK